MVTQKPSAEDNLYTSFNNAVNECFFDGRFAHTSVHLDLEDPIKLELSQKLSCDPKDVEALAGASVASSLELGGGNPYQPHLDLLNHWEASGRRTLPPFTGLLCVLSLAAERMRADDQLSSSNYYHRLLEVLGLADHKVRSKLTQNAKSTYRFWRALNLWLAECDFEFGRPTARQVNSWRYVSYAISQALVRDGDRRSFHSLFERLHLSPHDDVSEGEMMLYIHEWMSTSEPSAWLRKIWGVKDLRDRVVVAALTELESWETVKNTGSAELREIGCRLGWVATMSGFPRKKLNLWLGAVGAQIDTLDCLRLAPPIDPATKEAFRDVNDNLSLSPLDIGNILTLGPAESINIGPLMHASFKLTDEQFLHRFSHLPKPVIPLTKSEQGPFYREVARVALLKEHLVLCHKNWVGDVQNFLKANASSQFLLTGPDELSGIPKDWFLFQHVVFASSPHTAPYGLAALMPIAGGATIEFLDGLKLAAGIWHPEAPPRVAAVLEEDDFDLIISREAIDSESESLAIPLKEEAVSICLSALENREGGNFRAIIAKAGKEKAEKAISFRSAGTPRNNRNDRIGFRIDNSDFRWALSATSFDDRQEISLQGLRLSPQVSSPEAIKSQSWPELKQYQVRQTSKHQEEMLPTFQPGSFDAEAESCLIRGYHYFVFDSFEKGDSKWDVKRGQCTGCGLPTMTRSRTGSKNRQVKRDFHTVEQSKNRGRTDSGGFKSVPLDVIFDALCYLNHGSWVSFQRISAAHRQDLWFPRSLSHLLVGLGHMDLQLDLRTMRPKRWQIAPPALVESSEESIWFLAGFRSDSLLRAIGEALEGIGCRQIEFKSEGLLSRYAWQCDSRPALEEATQGIVDPLGRDILIVNNAAERLAGVLPGLIRYQQKAPTVHMESPPDLELFNFEAGQWQKVADSKVPGAYRSSYGACRYFHRDIHGSARAGTVELVKRLAAAEKNIALDLYEEKSRTFSTVLGCEPPGLFARALMACSGFEPKVSDGRICFSGVPPNVARIVFSKLYSRDI